MWQNRTENTKNINETETVVKQQLKKEDYEEIKNTITSNETATKKLLQQPNFKKFTSLKCKPKSAVKTVVNNNEGSRKSREQPSPTNPSYAQALKSNINTFEEVNSTDHHKNKPNKNINERLRSHSSASRRPKQGISRSRNNSKHDLSSNYKYQQEIKQLKEEIKLLKQIKNYHQEETE